jgi:hypothetical protein
LEFDSGILVISEVGCAGRDRKTYCPLDGKLSLKADEPQFG